MGYPRETEHAKWGLTPNLFAHPGGSVPAFSASSFLKRCPTPRAGIEVKRFGFKKLRK